MPMSATRLSSIFAALCIAALLAARTSDLSSQDEAPVHGHPSGEHHEHGDGDDRHDSPDSPCHHHDDHCSCSAPSDPALIASDLGSAVTDPSGQRSPVAADGGPLETLPTEIFHPPLA
ncbi:MAG: hypothetical protein AAB434_01735 [Planctomycetota bacterium]